MKQAFGILLLVLFSYSAVSAQPGHHKTVIRRHHVVKRHIVRHHVVRHPKHRR